MTRAGVVLGTAAYMSPEQACGEPVDHRTDIFSPGAVTYEMVTGHQPFEAGSAAAGIAATLTRDPPPMSAFVQNAPAELERIVLRALRKDRTQRYQNAKDMELDLRQVDSLPGEDAILRRVSDPQVTPGLTNRARRLAGSVKGRLIAPLIAVAGVVVAALTYSSHSRPRLTERDTLLIAGFANTTDDRELGEALKQALAVHLEQSPFLSIVSDDTVSRTLRLMNRSPDESLTPQVAREICQRQGIKAYVTGSIRPMASQYVIGLEVVNGETGESIAREQAEAQSTDRILGIVGQTASRIRERLGESLQTIQKFDVPIERVTTSSLDALKAFSLGMKLGNQGRFAEARPLFERAVELDPNFAIAYAKLAVNLANSGRADLASPFAARAYELRERTSEPERLEIIVRYHDYVTGNMHRLLETAALWKATYPREKMAWNMSAAASNRLGQYSRAIDDAREAIRLDSDFIPPRCSCLVFESIRPLRRRAEGARGRPRQKTRPSCLS